MNPNWHCGLSEWVPSRLQVMQSKIPQLMRQHFLILLTKEDTQLQVDIPSHRKLFTAATPSPLLTGHSCCTSACISKSSWITLPSSSATFLGWSFIWNCSSKRCIKKSYNAQMWLVFLELLQKDTLSTVTEITKKLRRIYGWLSWKKSNI